MGFAFANRAPTSDAKWLRPIRCSQGDFSLPSTAVLQLLPQMDFKKKKKSPPKKESERKPRPVNRLRDTAYVCRKSAGRDNSYKWEALGKYYCPQMAKINLTGWMPGCERKLYKLWTIQREEGGEIKKDLDLSRPELQVQNHVDLIKIKADWTVLPNRRRGWDCLG